MIELRTLGTVTLRRDGLELATVLAQPKRLALLAYLACARPRGFHGRDGLLALFWPEADAERARNSLRQALHHLRRALGDGALPGRGDRDVGVDDALLACDAVAFDRAIAEERWEDALAGYGGPFLPGLFVQDAPDAERWLDEERARLHRAAGEAAARLADGALAAGDAAAAVRWARRGVELDPTDERAVRRLVAALGAAGDVAGAEAAHDALARRLAPDDLAPAPETAEALARVRAARAPQPREAAVGAPADPPPVAPPAAPATVPPLAPTPRAAPAPPAARARPNRRALAAAAVVGLGAVLAVGAWLARPSADPRLAAPEREPTIAVLPFVNMSADPENAYVSDGLSEELLNLLAQVPGLRVAARTSSFAFREQAVPIDSIGRVLRVRHVLEGSVRQSGDRLRVTAQLIDARTGYHLWSGTFDRGVDDVLAVQDSIGRAIVDVLRPHLVRGGVDSTTLRAETRDPDAYVAVLKGWRAFRLASPDGRAAAAVHFAEAMRRDERYARALAGLATVRAWQAIYRERPPATAYAEAETLARRALSIDSASVDALLVLARIVETRDRDDAAADEHYRRALAVAPDDPRAHGRRAALLVRAGRADEAVASARRAVALDPASPGAYSDLANTYYALDRYAEQREALHAALQLHPGHPALLSNLALSLLAAGRAREADSVVTALRVVAPGDVHAVGLHARIRADLRDTAAALATLDTAARAGVGLVPLANTYVALGARARALDLLERAVREQDDGVAALLDPGMFPSLRDDPRLRRLVARVRGRAPAR